jgi:hypothetical protein
MGSSIPWSWSLARLARRLPERARLTAQELQRLARQRRLREVRQRRRGQPAVGVEPVEPNATDRSLAPEHVQAQSPVGEDVLDAAEPAQPAGRQTHPLAQAAAQAVRRRLARSQLAAGELPQATEQPRGRPPHRQRAAAPQQQRRRRLQPARLGPAGAQRQRLRVAGAARRTVSARRARGAAGSLGRAQGGAELHQRLVQVAGPGAARELGGGIPQAPLRGRARHVLAQVEDARQHARDVAVHHRLGPIEGDRSQRPGGVAADARQLAQGRGRVRQPAAVLLVHHARGALEVARARVVAETGPDAEHGVGVGDRQGRDVGEAREEALVVGDHRLDARLLEHRLGDPDGVGVARAAPGQVAPVLVVPGQQPRAQRLHASTGSARSTAMERASTRQPRARNSTPARAARRRASA